jgi:hypothetical protein
VVIVSSYSFIDASTEGYEGDDENIYGEEGEHFDQYTNQGKLTLLQSPKCKALPEQGTITIYFYVQ